MRLRRAKPSRGSIAWGYRAEMKAGRNPHARVAHPLFGNLETEGPRLTGSGPSPILCAVRRIARIAFMVKPRCPLVVARASPSSPQRSSARTGRLVQQSSSRVVADACRCVVARRPCPSATALRLPLTRRRCAAGSASPRDPLHRRWEICSNAAVIESAHRHPGARARKPPGRSPPCAWRHARGVPTGLQPVSRL
jgi:hypothetical protein